MILMRPWFLILLVVPFVLFHARDVGKIGAWKKICDAHLLPYLSVKVKGRKNAFYKWYITVLWAWLVLAAAGPAFLQKQNETFSEKKAVVAVLDMSPAMTESLLNEARFKLFDFVKTTQADVGFVISDAQAYTVVPITPDKAIIQQVLPTVDSTVAPLTGSAPEKGLQRAEELLQQAGYTQGQILLLTAGIVDMPALEKAAQKITYPITILGFGESAPHPVSWQKDFWKDSKGVPYQVSLDARRLGKIGFYQKSVLDNRDLAKIEQKTGEMERTQHPWENYQDVGVWLVLLALPFAAVLFRRGVLWCLLFMALSTPSQAAWFMRQEQEVYALQKQGVRAYRRKDFEKAEQFFASANDLYNQANARAMQHDFPGAIDLYEQELALHPDNEDARFNRDYLKQLLQQQPQQQSGEQQSGEQQEPSSDNKDQQGNSPSSADEQQSQNGQQSTDEQKGENEQQGSSEQQPSDQGADNKEQQGGNAQQETQQEAGQSPEQQQAAPSTDESQTPAQDNFEKQQQLQWLGKIEPDVSGLLRYRLRKQAEEAL
ncbi:MAG: hypothetical protein ILP11_03860 [Alphaproteobacteria bacterium]|nr:hypothetical protein [Alphaproteobacteria bacterium]